MWSIVQQQDTGKLETCVGITGQMDRYYKARLTVPVLQSMIAEGCEVHLDEEGDVKMVMVFKPLLDGESWSVFTAGYTGPLTPKEALDRGVQRAFHFIKENGLHNLTVTRRLDLDHDPLNQALDAVFDHPAVRTKERARNNTHVVFTVQPAASCSDKTCLWEWLDSTWVKREGCPSGCDCPTPSTPGTQEGQQTTTRCM